MSELARRLDEAVRRAQERTRVPGVAVALIHDGEELASGWGVTSTEHPLPVDERTLFQVASLTKPFTATALMRLVERGDLALAQPVRELIPKLRLPGGRFSGRLLVEHLVTHRGGFDGDRFFVRPPRESSLEALVAEFADNRQLFPPGEGWSYNNAGFSLVGRLLELHTGSSFGAALRALVLEPLGLDHSFLHADEVITHRVASPHVVGAERAPVLRGGGWQPGWELQSFDLPAGGLISCAADLLGWARFQLGAGGGGVGGAPLLRPETLRRMQAALHPAGCNDTAVGIAWLHREYDGLRFIGHSGSTVGYLSEILLHPERRFACVLLTNSVNDGGLRRELREFALRTCLGLEPRDPTPLPESPSDSREFLGRYDNPFYTIVVRASETEGELLVEGERHPPSPRRWCPPPPPPSRARFVAPDRVVALAPEGARGDLSDFGRDANGRVAWLRFGGRVSPRLP